MDMRDLHSNVLIFNILSEAESEAVVFDVQNK